MVDQLGAFSSAGLKFMDFAIRFFNMWKCQYQQQNQVKANKAGFQVLFIFKYARIYAAYYEFFWLMKWELQSSN